jgi:hypothetical protein
VISSKNMGNRLTVEETPPKDALPHIVVLTLLFFVIMGLIRYIYFRDIVLVSQGRPEDFELQRFLTFNFGLHVVWYPFKFFWLACLFSFGSFLFKAPKVGFLTTLKVVIIAELIKQLPSVIKFIWFSFVAPETLEGYFLWDFNDYFSLNGLLGISREEPIHRFFGRFNIFNVLYALVVAKLFQMTARRSYLYQLNWSALTYFLYVVVWGLISTLIAL